MTKTYAINFAHAEPFKKGFLRLDRRPCWDRRGRTR
jgi:hypothetical protein